MDHANQLQKGSRKISLLCMPGGFKTAGVECLVCICALAFVWEQENASTAHAH